MFNSKTTRAALGLVLAALVVGGCCCPSTVCCPDPCAFACAPLRGPTGSAKPLPPPGIHPSGFLDDYSGLTKSPKEEGSWVWLKPGLDLRTYDRLLIDEIPVLLDEEGQKVVTAEMRKKASDAFRQILVETLDPYYDVVDQPGENVLRVRLALTDLVPTKGMEEGKPPLQAGGAELEGVFSDSRTGEVLLRVVSRIEGSERGEVAKPEWQAVEGAFREWADRLLTFLDSFKE